MSSSSASASAVRTSVIVCCFNSAARLGQTLRALARQDFSKTWELVVVDNRSTDDTAGVARRGWDRSDVPLTILQEARQGLVWARLRGLSGARGEWVCFVDDDNHLEPRYLQTADEILARLPDVGIVGGEAVPQFECEPSAWLKREWWRSLALGPQASGEGKVSGPLYGAGICVRRQVWSQLQKVGWRPLMQGRSGHLLLSGEDSELCLVASCLGWQAYFSPRMRLQHQIPRSRLTWQYWLRLYGGFGRTAATMNVLSGVLRLRRSRWRRSTYLLLRACYAVAHIPGIPIFWAAPRLLPCGSSAAIRGSFRFGYASEGVQGVLKVWRTDWLKSFW